MADFAALTLTLDSTGIKQGITELDRLGDAGDRAEKDISRSTGIMSVSLSAIKKEILGLAAGFSVVQVAAASFSSFREFEKQIASVSTLIDESVTDINQLRDATLSLGTTYGKMPAEQAKAFYQVVSSGVTDTAKATELLDQANKLSIGGFADLFNTADSLTSILAAYGDKVKDVADISDTLFVGTLAGKTTIDELAGSLGRVSPLAENLGVSFQELVASVSALTLSGISTNEAITGVRAVLSAVIKPSSEAASLAKDLGIQFNAAAIQAKGFGAFMEEVARKTGGSSEKISLLFGGVEAIVPALAFAGNAGKQFSDIMGQMESRAGSTQTAFEKMAASPGFQIDKLMASINSMAIRLGDALAGVLVPAADAASAALNRFLGTGQKLSAIDQQKQSIASLRNELQELNNKKNIPLIGELIFDKKQADALEARIDSGIEDLKKLENQAIESSKKIAESASKTVIPQAVEKPISTTSTKQSASKSKEISESERFIQSLKKEAEEANKTEIELMQLRASKLGVAAAAAPLIAEIERNTIAFNAQRESATNLANDLLDVERVTESVITAEEKLAREQERLNKLLNLPNNAGISLETYNRALRRAQDEFVKFSSAGKKSFDDVSQFAIQAERNIQTAFGDALRQGFEGNLSGMLSSFKSALASMVAQAISADLLGKLFGRGSGFGQTSALLDSFKSIFSGGKTASIALDSSSFTDGISKLGDIFKSSTSSLSNIFSKMPKGAFTGASFLGGPGTALANGPGAGFGGGAGGLVSGLGGTLAGAGVGIGIGTMLGGDKKVLGLSSGILSTGGALVGSAFGPLGAAIGGALGGAIAGLFGRGPLKQKETNLIGSATAEGFEGITSTKLKAQGGLLVSDKVIRIEADADTGKLLKDFNGKLGETAKAASEAAVIVGRFVDEGIQGISKSLKESAQALGINIDVLKDFTQSINIASEKGKGLTEEQLGKVVSDFGDAMARKLLPEIDNLTKGGETAAQAFSRLGNEFQLLVDVLEVTGKSTAEASDFLKGVSFESRDAFLKLAGGSDKLAGSLLSFSDNFLTVEERIAPVAELVNKTFGELGISGIKTNDQFKQLVLAQDLTTEAGQKMFLSLIDISDEFATVTNAFGQFGGSLQEITEQINKATEAQIRAAERRATLEARERKQTEQKKVLDDLSKAREEETANAIELRKSLLLAGDAAKLLANELVIKKPAINKDADFAAEFARVQAVIAKELIQEISDNALVVNDALGVIRSLSRVVASSQRQEGAAKEIKQALISGIKDTRIVQSLDGLAKTMGALQVGKDLNRFGQGLAGVLSGFNRLALAQARDTVGGKEIKGADVIAYAKTIDSLNKDLSAGRVGVDEYNKAITNINARYGDLAKLLASPAEQLERIRKEGKNLASKGFESINFYFKQITKQANELDQQAKALDTPLGNVLDAIGRFKSITDVFRLSVKAIEKGLKAAGESFEAVNKAGSQVSKAGIIGRGAAIAQSVINTETGKLIQERIKNDPLFKRDNVRQLRDVSLLLGDIKEFDTDALEGAFTRINNALIKGQVNEAQYAKLFNLALDTFEGLEGGINGATSSLGQLRKAAREAADNILLDKKLTVLNPAQQFKVAERQFLETLQRAKEGDASASGQLEGAAKTLLEAGFISRNNQTDLFTFVQAKLREVEGAGGGSERLEVDQKILKELEGMNKRLDAQQKANELVTAQVASINLRATDTLERWEKIGMPVTRT